MQLEVQFANPNGTEFGDRTTSQSPVAAMGQGPRSSRTPSATLYYAPSGETCRENRSFFSSLVSGYRKYIGSRNYIVTRG
jgi:hypothetical protein